jgi:glycosyltransferase involved in cell wall biosynthesis
MVSVCMATYNGAKYIKAQLDSILKQLDPNDEIVISDDSSDDDTVDIIRSLADARIKLHVGNTFKDPIKNFQNCLQMASGQYIFLSDQDDVWMEGKYIKMRALLHVYDLVISDSIIVDENLKMIKPSFFKYFGSGKGIIKNITRSGYYGSCMAFTSKLLKRALPFPDTKEIGHDLWIGLVGELTGKVLFYKQPFLLYRRHDATFTHTGLGKSRRSTYQKLRGRVIMLKEVVRFLIRRGWNRD